MRFAETLLIAASIGRGLYGRWRLHQLVSDVKKTAILAVAVLMGAGIFIMSALASIYLLLLEWGMQPLSALLGMCLLAFFVMLSLLVALRRHVKTMKTAASTLTGEMTNAFLDGLLAE